MNNYNNLFQTSNLDSSSRTTELASSPSNDTSLGVSKEFTGQVSTVKDIIPREYIDNNGSTFLEKVPGHYAVFIPQSIPKEWIIKKILKPERKKPPRKTSTRVNNSFFLYRKDVNRVITKLHPKLNQKEISKIIAE
ncbi:hypothetical protein BB560_004771, partial [Smittium megazygosporum]